MWRLASSRLLGRFYSEKGSPFLVETFEHSETDAKLVMAGADDCDDYSRELRDHASERIRARLDYWMFVPPSDLDGLSLLDAMGAGLCAGKRPSRKLNRLWEGAGFRFERGNGADWTRKIAVSDCQSQPAGDGRGNGAAADRRTVSRAENHGKC
jgi:hypothetical protein